MKPEFRRELASGGWVIVAAERSRRPNPFRAYPARVEEEGPCPFCPGHEGATPHEILAYRGSGSAPDQPGWHVRVVPNLYPALRVEGTSDPRGEGIYDRMGGVGAHEVVIETHEHEVDTAERSLEHVADVLRACRARVSDLYRDRRFAHVVPFKNRGAAAGATRDHPHTQLIALPIVAPGIERAVAGAERYHDFRGRCAWCDVVAQETEDGRRIVTQNGAFVAVAPFDSRSPYQVTILPRAHASHFREIDDAGCAALAEVLRDILRRYALHLRNPAYNYVIHSAPRDLTRPEAYHWHLVLRPRLVEPAGFEWGTDIHINPLPPEDAAAALRDLDQVMDVPAGYLLDG